MQIAADAPLITTDSLLIFPPHIRLPTQNLKMYSIVYYICILQTNITKKFTVQKSKIIFKLAMPTNGCQKSILIFFVLF
jgi:hypothetical protein